MAECVILLALVLEGDMTLDEIFRYLHEKLEDQNPYVEENDLQYDLEVLAREDYVKKKNGKVVLTLQGKEFLRENKIFCMVEEAFRIKVWES